MPEIRIGFDDDELHKNVETIKERCGLTWRGLLLQGSIKMTEDAAVLDTDIGRSDEITPTADERLYLRALRSGEAKPAAVARRVSEFDHKRHKPDTVADRLDYLSKAFDYVEKDAEEGAYHTYRLTDEAQSELPFVAPE